MANFFTEVGEWIYGKPAETKAMTAEDPIKTGLSKPLSSYLQGQIGKGIPAYGGALSADLDPNAVNRFNEFLSLDSGEFFQEKVAAPATKRFKEDFFPVLQEGFAGNMRGSGRFRSEEDAISKFGQDLAGVEADLALKLPGAQFTMASQRKVQQDKDLLLERDAFFKSLPQFNPVIGQALQFLGVPSGFDTVFQTDPGQQGALKDLIAAVGGFFSGGSGNASTVEGGTTNVSGGTFDQNKSSGQFDSFFG